MFCLESLYQINQRACKLAREKKPERDAITDFLNPITTFVDKMKEGGYEKGVDYCFLQKDDEVHILCHADLAVVVFSVAVESDIGITIHTWS